MEPYRIREWAVAPGRLFTCGRPGRSKWKDASKVPPAAIHAWVKNLPAHDLVIVSLLGRKPDGTSEYSFYPFRGGYDENDERTPTFGAWLQEHYADRTIIVCEHPTVDFEAMPHSTLERVRTNILDFVQQGKTVVLMDSGGQVRTEKVCRFLELQEKFS